MERHTPQDVELDFKLEWKEEYLQFKEIRHSDVL